MKKKLIIALVVVVFGGGSIFAYVSTRPQESPYDFITVERHNLEERVVTTATVKAADEFELSFATSGRVAAVNVAVGDQAFKDGELAKLDTAALEARVRQQQAALSSAIAGLNQALAGASAENIAVAERAVDSAQIALNNAIDSREDTERVTEQNLDDAYTNLFESFSDVKLSAEGALQTMNPYYDVSCGYQCLRSWGIFLVSPTYETLLETQKVAADSALASLQSIVNSSSMFTPRATLDANAATIQTHANAVVTLLNTAHTGFQESADKTVVQTARLDLNAKLTALNGQAQLVTSTKSTNTTSLNTANQTVANAEAALASARASLDSLLAPPRAVDVASLRANVSSAQANLDASRADLDNAVIRAPIDGTITQVNVQAGEIAGASVVAVAMVSGATYAVEANVPEADIAKISVGDSAMITLDALPGQEFSGNVVAIDPAEQVIGGVVTFKVTTDIRNGISMLRPGMTADLEILTESVVDALAVPQRAVIREMGETFVRVVENNELVRVPVTTGVRSAEGLLEITSGLEEGVQIINFIRE